jgi:hypothetical protein
MAKMPFMVHNGETGSPLHRERQPAINAVILIKRDNPLSERSPAIGMMSLEKQDCMDSGQGFQNPRGFENSVIGKSIHRRIRQT